MKLFYKCNQVFRDYLSYVVLAVAVMALTFPNLFTWITAYLTPLLQFIMFTMGLTLTMKDFGEVFRRPVRVLLVEVLQFFFMPFSGFVFAKLFNLPDQVALGLILLGSVPGGTSSNIMAYLANGDVPLSISATSVSTLLAPLMTPIMLTLYGGSYFEMSFTAMFMSVAQVVLLPVVGGMILNAFFGKYTQKVSVAMPTFSSLAVLMVLVGTVAVNRDNLLSTGWVIFLVVFFHSLSGYLAGMGLAKLFKYDLASQRTMAIEVGLQNTSLAASLGLAHFSPLAALAGAAGTIVHTLWGTIYANLCAKNDAKKAQASQTQTYPSEKLATAK